MCRRLTHIEYLFLLCVLATSMVVSVPGAVLALEYEAVRAERVYWDRLDAVVRRTDPCGTDVTCGPDPIGNALNLPDLRRASIGRWQPRNANVDLYEGVNVTTGGFVRVELVFDGLVNPPGPITGTYNPTRYGSSPLFGFVEFDVDTNGDTGGNMDAPLIRYNGNVARFGGVPRGECFVDRISLDGHNSDNLYDSPPWLDRSGGDFELEFRGDEITAVHRLIDDGDVTFGPGETWDVVGRFFRQAQGYDASTGGAYAPLVRVRFAHVLPEGCSGTSSTPLPEACRGVTYVVFVFPLTNAAYPVDNTGPLADTTGSILERMWVLNILANTCSGTDYCGIIEEWENQTPSDYLDPRRWRMTMLFGTARTSAITSEGNYIWTDILPNVRVGDFNGDGLATNTDADMVDAFIAENDGDPDIDGDNNNTNGSIELVNFGLWFSVFDVDYDGYVDSLDSDVSRQIPYDYDNDQDVDLRDYSWFARCVAAGSVTGGSSSAPVACLDAFDVNGDNQISVLDYAGFEAAMTGP